MKGQINIRVIRYSLKPVRWGVSLVHRHEYGIMDHHIVLPMFRKWRHASVVAETLALYYRLSGYEIALDTRTCRKQQTHAFYNVPISAAKTPKIS